MSYSFGGGEDDFEVCRAFCEAKGAAGCCKLNIKNDNCDWFEGTEHYSAVVDKANRYTIMCSGTSTSTASPPGSSRWASRWRAPAGGEANLAAAASPR